MTTFLLKLISLVLILLNVLSAFGGSYNGQVYLDENDQSDLTIHRELQATTSIDYSGCYTDLNNADENGNGFIEQDEYFVFLQAYGKRVCYSSGTISLQQKSTFFTLACLCRQIDGDGSLSNKTVTESDKCCLGENAKLFTAKRPITFETIPVPELTVNQKEYFKTVCYYADSSLPNDDRNCDGEASIDEEQTSTEEETSDAEKILDDMDEEDFDDDSAEVKVPVDDEQDKDGVDAPKEVAMCRFKTTDVMNDGRLLLRQYSDPVEESITIQLIYNGIGWLGFGFIDSSTKPSMIYNTAVIGLPDVNVVQQYDLSGRSITGVKPAVPQSLLRGTIMHSSDQTIMTFTQSASEIGNIYNGTYQFIYAIGQSDKLAYHSDRGSSSASFALCEVTKKNETVTETENETNNESLTPSISPTSTSFQPTSSTSTSTVAPSGALIGNDASTSSMAPSLRSPTISTSMTIPPKESTINVSVTIPPKQRTTLAPSSSPKETTVNASVTLPPKLRRTAPPTSAPKLRGNGNGGKDLPNIINQLIHGSKGEDGTTEETPLPSSNTTTTDGNNNNQNDGVDTTNKSGLDSFIRWLRFIWKRTTEPLLHENNDENA
jgi:hypothetical protein